MRKLPTAAVVAVAALGLTITACGDDDGGGLGGDDEEQTDDTDDEDEDTDDTETDDTEDEDTDDTETDDTETDDTETDDTETDDTETGDTGSGDLDDIARDAFVDAVTGSYDISEDEAGCLWDEIDLDISDPSDFDLTEIAERAQEAAESCGVDPDVFSP